MRKQKVVNLLKKIKWQQLEEELKTRYPEELEDMEDYKKILWDLYAAEEKEMEEHLLFSIEIYNEKNEDDDEYIEEDLYYDDFSSLNEYEAEDYLWIKNSIVEFTKTEGIDEEKYTDAHLLLLLITEMIYGDILLLVREKRGA